MARLVKILASCRTRPTLEAVERALRQVPDLRLEAYNGALADVLKNMEARRGVDIMLLDVDLGNESELEVLTEVIERTPRGTPIIATSNNSSIDRVRVLMRLGLSDFVPQPIAQDDLVNSIAVARHQVAQQSQDAGRIIAFMRAAGGMGATTLAAQSACTLAQSNGRNQRICLIDLDIQGQAAGLYLNVDSPLSVIDCLAEPKRMDAMLIKSVVSRHKAGFDVLPAPKTMVALDRIDPVAVEALLEVTRSEYDVVLVDLPPVWTGWSDAVLANTDLLVLVTQVSVAGVRQARRQLDTLSERRLGAVPVVVVANRHRKRLFQREVGLREAERALGRKFDAIVPSDYKLVSEAHNAGMPVSAVKKRSRLEREVRNLVNLALKQAREQDGEAAANRLVV